MTVPLLPTGDGVILQDEALPQTGTLVVVETRPSYRGVVMQCGPDVTEVVVGDRVQYRHFVGTRIDVDGQSWMLVREADILCKLE